MTDMPSPDSDERCAQDDSVKGHWRTREVRPGAFIPKHPGDDVIDHDVDWLLAQCDRDDKAVQVLEDDCGHVVPLFVHDGQIDFNLGEFSFGSVKVRRHVLVGNFSEAAVPRWQEVLEVLRESVGSNGAVFLLGVVEGEGLHRAILASELHKHFLLMEQGAAYMRRFCKLGEGLSTYLGSLTAKHRQDMKRSQRRFEQAFDGRFHVSVCSSVNEVENFLSLVENVSKQTYQGRILGLAVTREGYIGNKVLEGARRGYTHCYLLTVDGVPVAWRIGFLYRGVYLSHHIGYNPDFDRFHPGVVMHLYSVQNLSEQCIGIRMLDMLYGDNDFKRKAGNQFRQEQNYYLFPRTFRGRIVFLALLCCNITSRSIGTLLARTGLKARVKAAIRRS